MHGYVQPGNDEEVLEVGVKVQELRDRVARGRVPTADGSVTIKVSGTRSRPA